MKLSEYETRLTVDERDLNAGFKRAEQRGKQYVDKMSGILSRIPGLGAGAKLGGMMEGISEGLKLLPGLNVLATGITKVAGAVNTGVQFGFDYNRMLQEQSLRFEVMLKSGDKARVMLHDLATLEKDGIELPEAAEGAKRLLAVGVAAGEVVPMLRAIGNAAAVTGADTEALARGLSQMMSKGAASSEELSQQLGEQGIDVFRYLAEAVAKVDRSFDKLTDEQRIQKIRKLVEAGRISGKGAAQAVLIGIQRDFEGGSARLANETVTGLEKQLRMGAQKLAGRASRSGFGAYQGILESGLGVVRSEGMMQVAEGIDAAPGQLLDAFNKTLGDVQSGFESVGISVKAGLGKGLLGAGIEHAQQYLKESRQGIGAHSPATEFIPLGEMSAQGWLLGWHREMHASGGTMSLFMQGGGSQRARLEQAADNPTVRAFMEAVRRAEGGEPNVIVGGGRFSDMSRHPNKVGLRTSAGASTAAGSWQITGTNWRRIAPQLGLQDFSERSQLIAALQLLDEEGGLDRLLGGDISGALRSAGEDWAALPGKLPARNKISTNAFMQYFQNALSRQGGGLPDGASRTARGDRAGFRTKIDEGWYYVASDGTVYEERTQFPSGTQGVGMNMKTRQRVGHVSDPHGLSVESGLPSHAAEGLIRDFIARRNGGEPLPVTIVGGFQVPTPQNLYRGMASSIGGSLTPEPDMSVAPLHEVLTTTQYDLSQVSVTMQPLEAMPDVFTRAAEATNSFNRKVEQTVPIMAAATEKANKTGLALRGIFEEGVMAGFHSTEEGFNGMARNMVLTWAQMLLEMQMKAQTARIGQYLFGDEKGGGLFQKALGWGANFIGNLFGGGGGGGGGMLSGFGVTSATGGAQALNPAGGFFGNRFNYVGGFAEGGYIPAGKWGIAGEKGIEPVFGGRTGATVLPHETLKQASPAPSKPASRTVHLTVHFNGQEATPRTRQSADQVARQLADMLEHNMRRGNR